MSKEIKLKDLYIGATDGGTEAKDKNFINYFYTGNNYYNVLNKNKNKFIIAGKKGTGKTLLAKYFEYHQNNLGNPTKLFTERDYVLNTFIELGSSIPDVEQKELLLEYIILTQIGRILYKNKYKIIFDNNIFSFIKKIKALKYINNTVNKRRSNSNLDITKSEIGYNDAKDISFISALNKVGLDINLSRNKNIKDTVRINNYKNQIDTLKDNIVYLLNFISVNLLVDDLDEYKKISEKNDDFIDTLISFIKVSYRLNLEFPMFKSNYSRIILLIRTDIMKKLNNNSSNLNKIISDSQIVLNWRRKTTNNQIAPLIEMIVTKIKNSSPLIVNKSSEEIIKSFLPKKVYNRSFDMFLRNWTFGKPRDIVLMLSSIQEEFPEAESFKSNYFKLTRYTYGKKLMGEIRNEMHMFYESSDIEQYLGILQGMQKYDFEFDDIKDYITSNNIAIDPEKVCEVLYEFGVIGNYWIGASNKKIYSWAYDEESLDKPNKKENFVIHFAIARNILGNRTGYNKTIKNI